MLRRVIDRSGRKFSVDTSRCLEYGLHFGDHVQGRTVLGVGPLAGSKEERLWVRVENFEKKEALFVVEATELVPLES